MKRKIDTQEKEIVRQLICDPRISDNQITKNTSIPLKTVNRKRKKLEEEGLLQYFTYLDTSEKGTGDFNARQMYIITFKHGITRQSFLANYPFKHNQRISKHILESHIGEKEGRLSLVLILESRKGTDLIEILNAEIIPAINQIYNSDAIYDITNLRLSHQMRLLHNYTTKRNIYDEVLGEQFHAHSVFVTDQ